MFYVTKINQNITFAFLFIFLSCATEDPTLIQLPDTTAPSGYIVSPLNGSSVSGNTSLQVIAIDNEEVDTVYFMIKSQRDNSYRNVDSTTNVSNDIWSGKWNTQNSEWVENENYFITFKAVDLVGNEYIAAPVVVKLDNQDDESPVGYIKNPITGQTVAGQVSIEVEASDNKSIQYVSIFINNEIKITHLSEPYTYNWNTELETDDLVYSIYAVIVDVDNNRTTIPPISVTVNNLLPTDVTPPTGALTSPPAGSTVYGNTSIQVTAADDQLIDYIEFYIDGNLNGTFDCNGPSCTASYNWETIDENEGEHIIQVILVDGWNNSTILTPISVVVDNIDQDDIHPTAVITSPASGETVDGNVLIETLVTDNLEVDKVEFFINNESVYTDSIGSDYSFLWETDTLPDDENYVLAVIAYDLVGNEGPSTAITIYLDNDDNVLPHGSILYPYAGQIVSGVETISINAEDNNSIDTVEFYINNILVFSDDAQPYEYDWDTNLEMEDFNHIVGSIIIDDSGNQFEIPSISVFVNNIPNDSNPPTITISNPLSGQTVSDTVNFLVAAYDDIGIAYVEFFIDGFSLGTDDEAPFSYLWDTSSNIGVHGNQHALSAIVVDTAGNTTFSQPILVIVED
ncbi:MAG: Ig-like domain-containing protein [Candidatus Neomarinimicrobiota bacterium]